MRALALASLLLLAACNQPAEQAPAETPKASEPAPTPSLAKPLAWTAGQGAIVLQEGGADVLRIACTGGQLLVHGERFKPVGSEERMSIGAGDAIAVLVATPADDRTPPTVKGEGDADPAFLAALGEGRKIAVNYGYQNMGPYDGPPAAMAQAFVAGCRG
jgi:hypothetical protein